MALISAVVAGAIGSPAVQAKPLSLMPGDSGRAVYCIQRALNVTSGHGLREDGLYGRRTGNAVRSFQVFWDIDRARTNPFMAHGIYSWSTGTMMNRIIAVQGHWPIWSSECYRKTPGGFPFA